MATVLRPFRSNMAVDADEANRLLGFLSGSFGDIFQSRESKLSYEELYRGAYQLVLYRHGDRLYSLVESSIKENLNKNVVKGLEDLSRTATPSDFLAMVFDRWDYYCKRSEMVSGVLMYMDKSYCATKQPPLHSSREMALKLWFEQVVQHQVLGEKIIAGILHEIEQERNGGVGLVDRENLKRLLAMLVEVGINSRTIYQEVFERRFLIETRAYYAKEAEVSVADSTVAEYLQQVEKRILEEQQRVKFYLHESTGPELLRVIDNELISKRADELANSRTGCNYMFQQGKVDDLFRMYNLFLRVPETLEEVKRLFLEYVKLDGEKLVEEHPEDKQALRFVKLLLTHRQHYEKIFNISFRKDPKFAKALKDGFEHVVNLKRDISQFVTLFIDDLMKDRAKNKVDIDGDRDLDETLDRIITIFRHLHERDIFEDFYKQLLAKRLLTKKKNFQADVSVAAERLMISKLKLEIGLTFTSKLETMLKDIQLSDDETAGFKTFIQVEAPELKNNELVDTFEATVLTTGSWPYTSAKDADVPIPDHIKNMVIDPFEKYYLDKHDGRRLDWVHSLGSAEIRATFGAGPPETRQTYILVVSTYQMLILDLFNTLQKDEITFAEIFKTTKIPEEELKRHLISLAAPKYRILNKEPKGKSIEPDDIFSINQEFTSNLKRVRVPLISARSQPATSSGGNVSISTVNEPSAQILEDRKHLTEAAIVRIMKARKSMLNNDLIAEAIRQLSVRFKPTPQDVKARIDALLERDYIERDENDRRMFHYMA